MEALLDKIIHTHKWISNLKLGNHNHKKLTLNKEKDPKCQKRKKRKETQNFTVQEIGMELYKQST